MITVKFGGTSLANAENIRRCADIVRSDPQRKFVVVSAPGKRFSDDIKITDRLYQFQASGDPADFAPIEDRFRDIIRELELELDLTDEFEEMKGQPHSADYMASCGEYLSARIMAAYLDWPFVDAEFCICFDADGRLDQARTDAALQEKLKDLPHAVLPGFYGAMPNGEVRTFSRGGSDITGSLVARAMGAEVYENWTDVDGLLAADPRIVENPAAVPYITYAELQDLAYQGASVLHEDAVRPVWDVNIPIHICNTFHPEAAGSWILSENSQSQGPVTGVAGRKGYTAIQLRMDKLNGMVGYLRKVLGCLENHHVSVEHIATGLNTACLVVLTKDVTDCRAALDQEIRAAVRPDQLTFEDGLAMIAVVGQGMIDQVGIAHKLFAATAEIGVKVRVIDQGSSEMDIVIGVDEKDYEYSVRAIYRHFFG